MGVITSEKQKVQYEICAIGEAPKLLPCEKALLRDGMDINECNGLGDTEVALIRGEEILKMWRRRIEHGVSEGNAYEEYARSISPGSVATSTQATKIATKLIEFKLVDISKVELPAKTTKREREKGKKRTSREKSKKESSKKANKQASNNQASKQASKQTSKQASKQASKH